MQDDRGQTALYLAVLHERKEVAKALVEAGADLQIKNHDGVSVFKFAKMKGYDSIAQLLTPEPQVIKEVGAGAHPSYLVGPGLQVAAAGSRAAGCWLVVRPEAAIPGESAVVPSSAAMAEEKKYAEGYEPTSGAGAPSR